MVSPTADWKPYKTQKTNIGAAQSICKAVLAQPNPDDIKVCYIGTVAETGDRNYPIHWGDAATLSKFLFMTIMLFQRLLLNAHSLKAELRIGL